jgi:methionyl-tRNA synthetase
MPETPEKFYLTTPIYYVNARPHIGHAYTTIVADVVARRHRLLGEDVYFLTGTDEHGQKIERSAAAAGIPPQQFADQVAASFEGLWKRMGITNDQFIRTTDPKHQRGAQKLFRTLFDRGYIELRSYTGTYCVSDEAFVDVPVGAPCPECGRITETITEENFFFKLSEFQLPLIELIESGTLGVEPEARRNEVLSFLRGNISEVFNQYRQDAVMRSIETEPQPEAELADDNFVSAEKYTTEAMHVLVETGALGVTKENYYVPGALKDLSISRTSFKWGIPVPGNEKHVIYVWLDALANYMTAVGYGSDDPADIAMFEKYWPADLHLVGKEIIRFHCVYWPAFLLAAGLPLPKKIQAHGWLLFEESKMSKSRGNVVRTETILDVFGDEVYGKQFPNSTKAERDLFASDVLRYFLLREIPFGQDGSFSFDAVVQRYNSDLANGYGNLVKRTFSMNGEIPLPLHRAQGDLPAFAQNYLFNVVSGPGRWIFADSLEKKGFRLGFPSGPIEHSIWHCYDRYDFTRAAEILAWAISGVDSHLSDTTPWKLPDGAERNDIIYTAAESIRIITALLYPMLPYATANVWAQLGLGDIEADAKSGKLKDLQWGGLRPGTKLGPLSPIFPRADKGLAQIMSDMESSNAPAKDSQQDPQTNQPKAPEPSPLAEDFSDITSKASATTVATDAPPASASQPAMDNPQPATPTIAIDDFVKIDLRVAQIVVAERIPKADKLLRLEVDLGPNFSPSRRQILSGIAEWYTPEELIGRRIAVIANLAPRKMRGLESHGMLLAASDDSAPGVHGKPILASFSDEIPLGSRIR